MVVGVSDYFRVLQLYFNGKGDIPEHASVVYVHPEIFLFCIFRYVVNQIILLKVPILVHFLLFSIDYQLH